VLGLKSPDDAATQPGRLAAGVSALAENRTSRRPIAKPSSENLERMMLSEVRSVNYIN
jgi:hypothetical protein